MSKPRTTQLKDVTATATEVNHLVGVTSGVQSQLNDKQATLVSGTNIKTVNSTSILGSGDIALSGGAIDSVNTQTGIVVLDTDDIADTATNRYTNDTDITRLTNTSGTNTGDVTVSGEDFISLTGQAITANPIDLDNLSATGTPSASTFLRGDNSWATPAGSGDVSKVGTPVNNQVGVWTGDGTLEGDANLTFDTATDTLATINVNATTFTGALVGNASTVTTNANLTGVVTSTGNATAIADNALSIAKTSGLQTELDLKAPLASPTFTGTVAGITKTMVGLGNVDNTSNATERAASAALTNKTITDSTNNVTANGLRSATTTVSVSGATAPTTGQVLTATNSTTATWQAPASSPPVELGFAVSDEDTALTTGTAKLTFRMPHAMTLTGVRANVKTAPTGSTLIVDINEAGTTVLSTKLSIDATSKTSVGATVPPVISESALADDAEMTIDIDQVGSTIAGEGLKIWLIGTRV